MHREYQDIPGTYVMDSQHCRAGYHLNMFCMTLNKAENRAAFKADEAAYVNQFPLTDAQKKAVLERDWLGMLQLGGNIYYTFKIAAYDGRSMQYVGGAMSSVSEEEFRQMMVAGGRSVEGNRSKKEQANG